MPGVDFVLCLTKFLYSLHGALVAKSGDKIIHKLGIFKEREQRRIKSQSQEHYHHQPLL